MATIKTKRITSYGVYAYRTRASHGKSGNAKPARQWDLHATLSNQNTAYMQGKVLALQPGIEKVEILRQDCDPNDGICNSKVIKVFQPGPRLWERLWLWLGGLTY